MAGVVAFNVTTDPAQEEVEQLFTDHSAMVYRAAYRVTGSAEDAEDVVQGLFLGLLTREFPPGLRENPKAYLHRSAINSALNLLQSRRRRAASLEAAVADPAVGLCVDASAPVRQRELQEQLASALSQLRPNAVELLMLRYEHGCKEKEIARLLGMSRPAVAIALFRARGRLRKLMRASGDKS